MVVVSAHSVDFVWRAGGTIAKYAELGWDVNVLVLSLGVRGESASLWTKEGQTPEAVGAVRRSESEAAAGILGCKLHFFDLQDYRMTVTDEVLGEMVAKLRQFRPSIILTHSPEDPFNPDHPLAYQASVNARLLAGAAGVTPESKAIPPSRLFAFEPHQPELSSFKPEVLVDISAQMDRKMEAMKQVPTQAYLANFHLHLAEARGYHARRNGSNPKIQYAEAFQSFVPIVVDLLP
jgi:4-oxalomesaconate hydratase